MISVKNLNVKLKKDGRYLVKDLNFDLNPKDKVAIIGEEGNGKSTLIKALMQDSSLNIYCDISGDVIIPKRVGYLPQFLDSKWNGQTIEEFFQKENPQDELDYSDPEIYDKLFLSEKIIKKYKFFNDVDYQQDISTLSGGEKIKIQLAKILTKSPELLILDEPTNDIDKATIEWLENFIKEQEMPILFVSHDEYLIDSCANGILHLEQVKSRHEARNTFFRGNFADYIEQRDIGMQKQHQQSRFQHKMWAEMKARIGSMKANAASNTAYSTARIRQIKSIEKRLEREKEEMIEDVDVEQAIKIASKNINPIPSSKKIYKYKGDLKIGNKVLQNGIDFEVIGPQKIVIVGANGTGKTTFLRNVYSDLSTRSDIKVGYMPQNYQDLLEKYDNSVEFLQHISPKTSLTEIKTYLGCMKFSNDEMEGDISALSGGQKAKLLITGFVLSGCNVLVLDEPTRNLSPLSSPMVNEMLKNFKGAIISVSHDRNYINDVCDSYYEFKKKIDLTCKGRKKDNETSIN